MTPMSMIPLDLIEIGSRVAAGALVAAVWQGALLAGAAALGLRLVPKVSAAVRFVVWATVFSAIALLPLVPVLVHRQSGTLGAGRMLTVDARWSLAVAAIWLAMSAWRAGTLVVAAVRVRGLWRRATPVESLQATPRNLGRRVEVCTSDEVDRPSVIGFFSPRILIPAWLYARLTRAELEQIVLHETGHLRRSDDWMNLLQKLALVVFPLNPALAWVERKLCFERELACDDTVLAATGSPKAYAVCLASLAEHRMGRRGLALTLGALERVSTLERRVQSILGYSDRMSLGKARLVTGVAVLALAAGAAELAQCPQVIGFVDTGIRAQGPGVSLPTGYRMQDVVYRPEAPSARQWQVAHDGGAVMHTASGRRAAEQVVRTLPLAAAQRAASRSYALAQEGGKGGQAERMAGVAEGLRDGGVKETAVVAPARQRAATPSARETEPVAGWVVVTSWSAEDGSRMILTETGVQMGSAAGDSSAGAQPAAAGAVPTGKPSQVRPYAAVPVQGGWLVIQL